MFRYCVISNSIINKSDKKFIFGKKNSIKTFKRIFFYPLRSKTTLSFKSISILIFKIFLDVIELLLTRTHTRTNCFHFFIC